MKHEEKGLYYELNLDTHQKIICERSKLKSPNGFIFGTSGNSGKLDVIQGKDEQATNDIKHKH